MYLKSVHLNDNTLVNNSYLFIQVKTFVTFRPHDFRTKRNDWSFTKFVLYRGVLNMHVITFNLILPSRTMA